MDNDKTSRIQRFMADPILSEAVRGVLLSSFLKTKKGDDVNYLAASRIAIDLLADAWGELEKYAVAEEKEPKSEGNVGL